MTSVPPDHNAFVHREPGFDLVVDMTYLNAPGAQDAALDWLAGLYDKRWAPILNGQACEHAAPLPRLRAPVDAAPQPPPNRLENPPPSTLPSMQIKTTPARPTARSAPGACTLAATCPA